MATKLWEKNVQLNKEIERFTVGRDRELDVFLAKYDVLGSMAHITMLESIGLLAADELKILLEELREIYKLADEGKLVIEDGIEDVHSQVELMLTRKLGVVGKKIHSGRSRNDQVLVDLKLYARSEIRTIAEAANSLFNELQKQSEKYKNVLMPGYTHMQVAMPSSFGLWFGAYAESLADDLLALKAAYDMVNTNPLGSGAGYGSSIALNRQMTTDLLGFAGLAYNVVYAQMQRGKMEKNVLFGLAAVATTLGRLAADVCLFACGNFGFVRLPDKYTTGSSIMPHKKNPDIFELIRAKCNHLQSLPMQMAMICTNLTSVDFRDMQLTKELFLPAFRELNDSLFMAHLVLQEMEVKRDVLRDLRYAYIFSVEDVNERVMAGIPFREAYREIGMQIQEGRYRDRQRAIHHTHEGSMGNLCLAKIRDKFEQRIAAWDIATVREVVKDLLGNR